MTSPSTSVAGARCISIWHVRCDQLASRIHGITGGCWSVWPVMNQCSAALIKGLDTVQAERSAVSSQHFLAALKVDAHPVLCTGTSATTSTTLNPSEFSTYCLRLSSPLWFWSLVRKVTGPNCKPNVVLWLTLGIRKH